MVNGKRADFFSRSFQTGIKRKRVLGGIVRDVVFPAQDVSEGGEEISRANCDIAGAACCDMARPSYNKWHAMAAFVDGCFGTAKGPRGTISCSDHFGNLYIRREAVVRGEDD